MPIKKSVFLSAQETIELARKCLALISSIAARGASSQNPDIIGHSLQELAQVLFERTGSPEIIFEPIPADQIRNLPALYEELDFVESMSQSLVASVSFNQQQVT